MMVRQQLQGLPDVVLPADYSYRSFRAGDEQAWNTIINESFEKNDSDFLREIAQKPPFLPERVWFVCFQGQPVATATAWHKEGYGDLTGYLHMVGNRLAHIGQGLGLQVSLAALRQMKKEGRTRAMLETDDFRLPAVKTYLKLGFLPQLVHENQTGRWETVLEKLRRPDGAEQLPHTSVKTPYEL